MTLNGLWQSLSSEPATARGLPALQAPRLVGKLFRLGQLFRKFCLDNLR